MNLLETLKEKGYISEKEVEPILEEVDSTEQSLEQVLEKRGVGPQDVAKVKGELLDLPVRELDANDIEEQALNQIPEESARYYQLIPIKIAGNTLEVGAVDPDNFEVREALNFISAKSGLVYDLAVISEKNFQDLLEQYKDLSGEVGQALSELEKEFAIERGGESEDDQSGVTDKDGSEDESKIVEDAPVTKIVATMLRYAIDGEASDVHVEPLEENVRVRFRVDGKLNTSLMLPIKVHPAVVARIKILCGVKLDEKRRPQDGRFSATIEGRKIDFRVSTFPTYYGEKVVMRILDQEKGVKRLDDLGLRQPIVDTLKEGIDKPHGIILVSGPTGSGKSTTLYSLLQEVDKETNNVVSLEDPVEYNVEGVSQSQVRADIGYTFATGLRTILRQDPDIIMVGEIRDKETAQLAIQAALTGHLVFSTIHTNTAVGVIPRLIDMGVDPYLIAPTLVLAIAQRLVHQLCEDAKRPVKVEGSIKEQIDNQLSDMPEKVREQINVPDTVYEAGSSEECANGIRGRLAVMEVLKIDGELEKQILKDPNEYDITRLARSKGMLYMKEEAMLRSFQGTVPFSEIGLL